MITISNIPYIGLGVIGIGFLIIVLSLLILAHKQRKDSEYTERNQGESNRVEELFSFFLQEEEKKNDDLRKSLSTGKKKQESNRNEEQLIKEITDKYDEGKTPEEIAKLLKIGVGEVQLILSLYNMR